MVEKLEFVMPPQDGAHLKDRFRQALSGASMTDYAPFPLIDLSGSPRERGRIHGKAAADRLRRGARMYAESLLKSGVDWKELERRAERDGARRSRSSIRPTSRRCAASPRARASPSPPSC